MTQPDLLRPSRDGDQFHYTWAARQSLRLLDRDTELHALFVEGVDPSEQLPASEQESAAAMDTPLTDRAADNEEEDEEDEEESGTGDEVIDLTEYWGSSKISLASRVIYRQFKHSTRSPDKPWTLSFLTKTLIGFAKKYKTLKANHEAVLGCVRFEFISNRPPAQSALKALDNLRTGTPSHATITVRKKLAKIIPADDITHLCKLLVVDDRAPSLLKLRHLLDLEVSDLLPGAPAEQALLLREMISSRATSLAGDNPAVRRADVLASLKTSEDQLLPAPNLIEAPIRQIVRPQFVKIAAKIHESPAPTLVHGPGGVGKSVLAGTLQNFLPEGSIAIVFDCFGNGTYRRPSAPRHRAKQGFVQLVNELAGHTLCDPIIPSATADDADYARAFLRKLTKAAESLATTAPAALLAIVIDAADNAAMIADEMGEHSFVRGLLREQLPQNVRLIVTCRTERIDLLGLPAGYQEIQLPGFDLEETRAHLQTSYPDVSPADVSEFHSRTSQNPRVQAAVLNATKDLHEALAWLAPNPVSPGQALDSFIERQVAQIRDQLHRSGTEIDAICMGLAALRPMIPIRVVAELASVHPSVVLSFISDLGRPLLVDGDTVQFRDEPTETWFRDHYRPTGKSLDAFIDRLSPIADRDAYVAASLPALLFEANRFDDLVQLALSDDRLPDNASPRSQRNEIQRREIAQQRTHFALTAALRADRDFEAAQLALRLGALTAGRNRRLDLIRENTDLAARFLDPTVLEQLIATRSLTADWPNSNLPIEGALLSGSAGQTDQARNRLRSAISWTQAWTRQARRSNTESGLKDLDFLQIAWGLLNTNGPAECNLFLRSWRPPALAFDVGVDIARRLLDAGRLADFVELARSAHGRHLKLAIAHVCAERDLEMETDILEHLLRSIRKRKKTTKLSRHDDYGRSAEGAPLHDGLTAVIWLTSNATVRGLLTPAKAARILRVYLPESLGHWTGSWYDPDIWYPILGLTLCARLEGREIDPIDMQGSRIREARKREKFESSSDLRTYRANVEPLVDWAVAWLDLLLDPTDENRAAIGRLMSEFLGEAPPEWREERIDQTKVNTVLLIIGRALTRFPGLIDEAALLNFQAVNNDVISRRTLTHVIRQTATNTETHGLSSELAKRCHSYAAAAREDAGDLASDFVHLARATYRISPEESVVHFQAAIDITNAIGDDAWARWGTLLAIASYVGEDTSEQQGRAYRLCQIAESLEPYLGDRFSHLDVLSVAARLSLPEALAAGSRWRDRRISPLRDLANAALTTPTALLNNDPIAALALLPLGDRYPDHTALASALVAELHDPTSSIVAYLQFRRPDQMSTSALDELLDVSGVTRRAIEQIDPSLLRTSSATAKGFASDNNPTGSERSSFGDLDLMTASGWAAALDDSRGHSPKDIFDYAAGVVGTTPDILRAFGACPTTSYWDLCHLLESLQGTSVSMATQSVLDEVLATQLARFAPDLLLVSWRTFDFENARILTGRDTDYEHIGSRALAEQQSFTAEQAYALAAHLGRRLTIDNALQLFDSASSYFDKAAPLDAYDGNHPLGTAESWEPEAAVAAVIWTALGDPAGKTRWRASHSVHLALTLGHVGIISSLLDLASGRRDAAPFLDSRLKFYERHALQWLLYGINRSTVEPTGLAAAALCGDLLTNILAGAPHAVNTELARDSLVRLHAAGLIMLKPEEQKQLDQAARPIGTKGYDGRADLENVLSLNEIFPHTKTDPGSAPEPTQRTGELGDFERLAGVPAYLEPGADCQSNCDDDDEDEDFRFFFDFRQYWCNPLGDAFGINERSIERLVAEVLLDRWAVTSRGRVEDDTRHALKLYPPNNYPHKDDWPEEEDLDFYLALQALYEVAGVLLQYRPVVQRYDEDEQTEDSEYTRFLQRHLPSRDDGRWLSDKRDPAPANAQLETRDPAGLRPAGHDPHWIYRITSERFTQELFPEPGTVVVWGYRSVNHYSQNERVSVHSALVTPSTALALLKALQTSPDKHAYRIPDTTDEEFSSTIPGFELTGWIQPSGYAYGRDRQDPYAKSIDYPPTRPDNSFPPVEALESDRDMRLWRDGKSVVIVSTAWDAYTDERQTTGSSGETLVVDRPWLSGMLAKVDRWLIVEVEIKRRSKSTSKYDDEERVGFLPPYTKYFLIDSKGETHEF